ncbi:MAG: acyl-CoA thioesterase [Gemmataceae bacterium]|nr:acyl-CoA thioesterase [Gemmataceae bacterium]
MAAPFRTTRRVEFADTDMAGIVHFSNFFRYMESAEVDFLGSLALSVSMTNEGEHLGFPRVSATCDYLRPATFRDFLEIAVIVERVGTKSVTYRFEFFKDGELIARGRISAACCQITEAHGLKSIEIPASIRAKLEAAMSA